jgi:hypothetical protein
LEGKSGTKRRASKEMMISTVIKKTVMRNLTTGINQPIPGVPKPTILREEIKKVIVRG